MVLHFDFVLNKKIAFQNPSPERGASFLSKIFYTWYDGMVWKGFRKPLEYSDLWDLNPQNMTKEVRPVFEKHWLRAVGKNEQISESLVFFKDFGFSN